MTSGYTVHVSFLSFTEARRVSVAPYFLDTFLFSTPTQPPHRYDTGHAFESIVWGDQTSCDRLNS